MNATMKTSNIEEMSMPLIMRFNAMDFAQRRSMAWLCSMMPGHCHFLIGLL